jgi:hypothetical protein
VKLKTVRGLLARLTTGRLLPKDEPLITNREVAASAFASVMKGTDIWAAARVKSKGKKIVAKRKSK